MRSMLLVEWIQGRVNGGLRIGDVVGRQSRQRPIAKKQQRDRCHAIVTRCPSIRLEPDTLLQGVSNLGPQTLGFGILSGYESHCLTC